MPHLIKFLVCLELLLMFGGLFAAIYGVITFQLVPVLRGVVALLLANWAIPRIIQALHRLQ
jgi:hypothetical protein